MREKDIHTPVSSVVVNKAEGRVLVGYCCFLLFSFLYPKLIPYFICADKHISSLFFCKVQVIVKFLWEFVMGLCWLCELGLLIFGLEIVTDFRFSVFWFNVLYLCHDFTMGLSAKRERQS